MRSQKEAYAALRPFSPTPCRFDGTVCHSWEVKSSLDGAWIPVYVIAGTTKEQVIQKANELHYPLDGKRISIIDARPERL